MPKFTVKLQRRQLDEKLNRFRGWEPSPGGCIREIREALEMSSYHLAERMGVRQPSVMELEANERNGTITLNSLQRAAEALGCKLVYALVPEKPLEKIVQAQALRRAEQISQTVFRTMALERQSTGDVDRQELIEELAAEILRKGKRELWKNEPR